jgi:hypothetical protein
VAGSKPHYTYEQPPVTKPPATPPKQPTGPLVFGPVAPFSDNATTIDFSDDREAFTAVWSDLEVSVHPGSPEPASRSFSFSLPLTDAAKARTVAFHAQGFAYTSYGGKARMTLQVNDAKTFKSWGSNAEDDWVASIQVPATPGSTIRVSLTVEVHQHPSAPEADATLNVVTLDAEID